MRLTVLCFFTGAASDLRSRIIMGPAPACVFTQSDFLYCWQRLA